MNARMHILNNVAIFVVSTIVLCTIFKCLKVEILYGKNTMLVAHVSHV